MVRTVGVGKNPRWPAMTPAGRTVLVPARRQRQRDAGGGRLGRRGSVRRRRMVPISCGAETRPHAAAAMSYWWMRPSRSRRLTRRSCRFESAWRTVRFPGPRRRPRRSGRRRVPGSLPRGSRGVPPDRVGAVLVPVLGVPDQVSLGHVEALRFALEVGCRPSGDMHRYEGRGLLARLPETASRGRLRSAPPPRAVGREVAARELAVGDGQRDGVARTHVRGRTGTAQRGQRRRGEPGGVVDSPLGRPWWMPDRLGQLAP